MTTATLDRARFEIDADPDQDVLDARTRDPDAAARRLMRRHGTAVYRYCRTQLRDPALAEDVHQQIFVEAARDLPGFAGRCPLRIWLFTIARHRVLDAAKQRRRAAAHFADGPALDAPDPQPAPGEALDRARLHRDLLAALQRLEADTRNVVVLHHVVGLTFHELAGIYGERPGTLHARASRALERIRRILERKA